MYQTVLFDLDGTLTDPWEGITKCVQYALASFGIHEELEALTPFIGPPLIESFQEFYHMSAEEARRATDVYRERFSTVGLFENRVFPEAPALLGTLKREGVRIALATSKPEQFAVQIVEHFELARHFDVVAGSTMDERRTNKAEVVAEALRRLGENDPDPARILMVGDRKHDVQGARACGLNTIGVSWGFAPQGELEAAGAQCVVNTFDQLKTEILG